MGWHILKYIHTHIGKYTYTYSHIYIYKIYFAKNEKHDICVYIYILMVGLVCVKSKTRNNK